MARVAKISVSSWTRIFIGSWLMISLGLAGTGRGTGYRFKLHKVIDREGTGKLAFTCLIPQGWTASDQVKWLPQDYMTPVVMSSAFKSADHSFEIDTMSGLQENYSHGPGGDAGSPPPQSVAGFLLGQWKRLNPGLQPEVILSHDDPIDVSNSPANSVGRAYATRGTLKLRYTEKGRVFLMKAQARIDGFQTNETPTAIGGTIFEGGWLISNFFAVTAPESGLQKGMKLAGVVLASTHTDPHFYNTIVQAQQIIQQNFYSQQRAIMETSRIISQTSNEISDIMRGSYKTSQDALDREMISFDDTIRGIDRYKDSDESVQLPSGYAHAWSDGVGSFIVSDDHLYNPNVNGPGGTWHEMEKSR